MSIGRPARAGSPAQATILIRLTTTEADRVELARMPDESRAEMARRALLAEADRRIDLRDNTAITREGDRYRLTHGAWSAVAIVDVHPAGNGWHEEHRVELVEGEWPDEGIEAALSERVIEAWAAMSGRTSNQPTNLSHPPGHEPGRKSNP